MGEEAMRVELEALDHVGLEQAKVELAANGVEYEESDYRVAWSVYLPHPDGYVVEITTCEPAPA